MTKKLGKAFWDVLFIWHCRVEVGGVITELQPQANIIDWHRFAVEKALKSTTNY
jgi:hypothetical protein